MLIITHTNITHNQIYKECGKSGLESNTSSVKFNFTSLFSSVTLTKQKIDLSIYLCFARTHYFCSPKGYALSIIFVSGEISSIR